MSSTTILLLLAFLASIAPSVMANDASVYIDFTGSCGNSAQDVTGNVGPNWSDNLHSASPKCESQRGWSYTQLATNRIVAVDLSLYSGDFSEICGREIIITKQDGSVFQFSEGPLYAWEGCGDCKGGARVDLAAKAFVELNDGACGPNNPQILKWEFGDYVVDPSVGLGPGVGSSNGSGGIAGATQVPPASTVPAAAQSSAATAAEIAAGSPSDSLGTSVPGAGGTVPAIPA
ncbi:hypothetical protein IAU59_006902 [Kwoniella sp. CBS 9459]